MLPGNWTWATQSILPETSLPFPDLEGMFLSLFFLILMCELTLKLSPHSGLIFSMVLRFLKAKTGRELSLVTSEVREPNDLAISLKLKEEKYRTYKRYVDI